MLANIRDRLAIKWLIRRWRIEARLIEHNAPTRWPRAYLLWDWVVVGDMGIRRWISWATRR